MQSDTRDVFELLSIWFQNLSRVAANGAAPLRAAGPSPVTRAFRPEHEVGLAADRTRTDS